MMTNLSKIINKFGIFDIRKISSLNIGLINRTFLISTASEKFILQKLHLQYRREDVEYTASVSGHLLSNKIRAPDFLKSADGWHTVELQGLWRLYKFIPGRVFSKIAHPKIAYEAGKFLGLIHKNLLNFHSDAKIHHTSAHNPQKFFKRFISVAKEINFKSLVVPIFDLPKFYLKAGKVVLVHGDPKINNFIFSQKGTVVACIDLDNAAFDNILFELGDAFRSWCSSGDEDSTDVHFDLKKFEAGLEGYLQKAGSILNNGDLNLIPQAIKLITLELACRFAIDYEENNYFGWDKNKYSSRKEHNLARLKGQLSLYNDIVSKERYLTNDLRCR